MFDQNAFNFEKTNKQILDFQPEYFSRAKIIFCFEIFEIFKLTRDCGLKID